MEKTQAARAASCGRIVYWGNSELDSARWRSRGYESFTACDTASDDVCLIALHLRHDRRAEGHDAFPSRHAGDLRQLCAIRAPAARATTASSARRRSPSRSGSAGMLLFPFRIGAATILLEKAPPDVLLPAIAQYRATVCFTAPTAYRAMIAQACRARHLVAAQMRLGRRAAAEGDVRCLAQGDRHADHRRHRRDRDDAHLHRRAGARDPRRRDRQGRARLRGESGRRGGHACRPAPSAGSRCAGRPAAAISPTRGRANTCRTAGTSPATPM